MYIVYAVHKRGDKFFVVTTSTVYLTREYGPFNTAAEADSEADLRASELAATRLSSNDLDIQVVHYSG